MRFVQPALRCFRWRVCRFALKSQLQVRCDLDSPDTSVRVPLGAPYHTRLATAACDSRGAIKHVRVPHQLITDGFTSALSREDGSIPRNGPESEPPACLELSREKVQTAQAKTPSHCPNSADYHSRPPTSINNDTTTNDTTCFPSRVRLVGHQMQAAAVQSQSWEASFYRAVHRSCNAGSTSQTKD